jgi:hypothetical protein
MCCERTVAGKLAHFKIEVEESLAMKREDDREVGPPLAYRLALFFGRPLGLRWVGDNQLGAVYRWERYDRLCGPGFFWIKPLTESVKYVVSLNPDFISTSFPSVFARDGVQLAMDVALAFTFDPRPLPHEKVQVFVKWSRDILRAIVIDVATGALLSVIASFYAEQICRGELFQTIEQRLMEELTSRLEPLAMRPAFAMVLKVTPPLALQETFTAVANRAAYTHDLSLYQEFELNEVRRRELYAVLSELPGGIRYLNVTGPDVSPSALKSGRLPGPHTIRGEATPLSRLSPDVDDEDEAPQRPGIRPKSHL